MAVVPPTMRNAVTQAQDLRDHEEPQAAADDERRDDQVDRHVTAVAHQVVAEQGEPGVVERRHRVEQAEPQPFGPAHVLREPRAHDERADALEGKRQERHRPRETEEALHARDVQRIGQRQPLLDRDAPAERHHDER
jgi:hypothetical protein